MIRVWILERFVPVEETKAHIAEIKEIAKTCAGETLETANNILETLQEKLRDYPEGYWCGYVGKANYKHFCQEALDFMKRNRNGLTLTGVRVVEAQIENDAKYWVGYKNPVVSVALTHYLYTKYNKEA